MSNLRTKITVLAMTAALGLSACGKGRASIPGLQNFNADVIHGKLYVGFVATQLHWNQGVTLPIPGLSDATVSVAPDLQSSGTVFQFAIGIASLTGGKSLPALGLPDGRNLPGVQSGQMPRWDFDVDSLRLSLYLSSDAFGLFIPIKLNLPWVVSLPIRDERGNLMGTAYAVPPGPQGNGSGIFILLPYQATQTQTQPQKAP